VGCLTEDQRLDVLVATKATVDALEPDIAIVSSALAGEHRFSCPVIIYGNTAYPTTAAGENDVAGVLHRRSLTIAQLHATVHAAAAGLRVDSHDGNGTPAVGSRELRLIELIADGYSTREIAELMSYSERTIKKLITGLEDRLDARSRPQMVAQAIRRGLI
jgi:DNA-binding CsgD family transcriptional regulator